MTSIILRVMQCEVYIAGTRRPDDDSFWFYETINYIHCWFNLLRCETYWNNRPFVNSLLISKVCSMPSTRRQKAKERRSRQLDIMSDVENVDIMLGSYSRCDEENNISENEGNLDSGSSRPQQSSNVIGEDFRSLLNTNSRENSEITIETTRLINEEISNQMSRKLNEVKTSLSSQVQEAITAAITNTVLPAIQNTLETQGRLDFTMVDRGSNGPHLSPRPTDFTIRDRRSSGLQRNA